MSAREKRIISMNEQLDTVLKLDFDGQYQSGHRDELDKERDSFEKVAKTKETQNNAKCFEVDDIKELHERK